MKKKEEKRKPYHPDDLEITPYITAAGALTSLGLGAALSKIPVASFGGIQSRLKIVPSTTLRLSPFSGPDMTPANILETLGSPSIDPRVSAVANKTMSNYINNAFAEIDGRLYRKGKLGDFRFNIPVIRQVPAEDLRLALNSMGMEERDVSHILNKTFKGKSLVPRLNVPSQKVIQAASEAYALAGGSKSLGVRLSKSTPIIGLGSYYLSPRHYINLNTQNIYTAAHEAAHAGYFNSSATNRLVSGAGKLGTALIPVLAGASYLLRDKAKQTDNKIDDAVVNLLANHAPELYAGSYMAGTLYPEIYANHIADKILKSKIDQVDAGIKVIKNQRYGPIVTGLLGGDEAVAKIKSDSLKPLQASKDYLKKTRLTKYISNGSYLLGGAIPLGLLFYLRHLHNKDQNIEKQSSVFSSIRDSLSVGGQKLKIMLSHPRAVFKNVGSDPYRVDHGNTISVLMNAIPVGIIGSILARAFIESRLKDEDLKGSVLADRKEMLDDQSKLDAKKAVGMTIAEPALDLLAGGF